jgi:hypothetical protein
VTTANLKPVTTTVNAPTLKSVRRSVALESAGFTVAEIASAIVSVGTIAISDKIPESLTKKVSKTVSKICIEPYLDNIENFMGKCKIEECKIDKTKTREERAEQYAKTLTMFSSAVLLSLWAKSYARDKWNSSFGVGGVKDPKPPANAPLYKKVLSHVPFVNWSNEKRMIFAIDEGAHLGALLYLNTKGADITDSNIKSTSNVLQKTLGFDKERADRASTMFNVWEVPNFAGMVAGYGTILGKHAYGWPTQHRSVKFADIVNGTAKSTHAIT